jgi:glycosyltransferase involved in cell wall biosynthesis
MMETIQAFQACGWRVSFVPEDNFAHLPMVTSRLQRQGIETIYWPNFKSIEDIFAERGDEFDIVLISRVGPASKHLATVRSRSPKSKVIFNTVDLHFLREQREAELSQNPEAIRNAEKTRLRELDAITASELTIVHSTVEEEILKRETPQAKVSVFPWVSPVRRPNVSLKLRRNVLFVGGFRHAPNVDGLRWFLQDIWPRIRARVPDATFNVIGADAPAEFDAYNGRDGVTMLGWVQDLDPQLDLARVSVAPLRYGAGVKGKVITALSCGVPVVCTSIASEGTGMKHAQDVIVSDDAAGFAASVLRLMSDDETWTSLSESGLRFVEANYSRNAARERVLNMITAVGLKA